MLHCSNQAARGRDIEMGHNTTTTTTAMAYTVDASLPSRRRQTWNEAEQRAAGDKKAQRKPVTSQTHACSVSFLVGLRAASQENLKRSPSKQRSQHASSLEMEKRAFFRNTNCCASCC